MFYVERKFLVLSRVLIVLCMYKLRPVLMLRSRPRAVSTPTTSLAIILSQTMDMIKARDTMAESMAQCGGLLGFNSTAISTEIHRPGRLWCMLRASKGEEAVEEIMKI